MQCIVDPNERQPQYSIEVRRKTGKTIIYNTIRLISDSHADAIRGRGTRVWEVVRADMPLNSAPRAVLKDVWIDSGRQREGDILARLRADAENGSETHRKILKEFFLTVQAHGDVFIGDTPDTTIKEKVRALLRSKGTRFVLDVLDYDKIQQQMESESVPPAVTGTHHSAQDFRNKLRVQYVTYSQKSRYRIVFDEVCTPLYKLPVLKDVLRTLGGLCVGESSPLDSLTGPEELLLQPFGVCTSWDGCTATSAQATFLSTTRMGRNA